MKKARRGVGLVSFLILISFTLLISGCEKEIVDNNINDPFVGGTTGLTFSFQEFEPPTSVLDDSQEEFYITLLVKNVGEWTVPEGRVIASLSGIHAEAFDMSSLNTKSEVDISGTTKDGEFVMAGAEELLEFGEASYVNDVPADFSLKIRSDLCYDYKTQAITNLCLKKNVLKDSIEDVCDTTSSSLEFFNSGAPVHVSTMRQKASGSNKIQLTLTITNVAGDLVYLPGTFENSCVGNEDSKDKLKVTINNPQNNFNVECTALGRSNSGEIRLVNGKKELTCTIDTSDLQEVTYQDPLLIDLDYMYRSNVNTNLIVKDSL
jgi:hypothetical protein